jgi:hypothetical protein
MIYWVDARHGRVPDDVRRSVRPAARKLARSSSDVILAGLPGPDEAASAVTALI